MKEQVHLSWENFLSSIFLQGQQRVHCVSSSPEIDIFGDGIRDRIGIWVEVPHGLHIPDQIQLLSFLSVRLVSHNRKELLEIACLSPKFNRQFYVFATALADRVLQSGESPIEAFAKELESFASLAREKLLLSIEKQIGLLGELLVLKRMILSDGPRAIQSWVGPQGEPHDFKVGSLEFEVKTTSGTRRIHRISNLAQLMPSLGCSLFCLSVVLGPAGKDNGFSLATEIETIELLLKENAEYSKRFLMNVEVLGYERAYHTQYSRVFALRRPLAIVPVDFSFPVVTLKTINFALGKVAHRIEHLEYDVNVEGLEHEEGSTVYTTVFPWKQTT
jgi:hypothetical protein